jgi:AraC-like DNA-binding protein
MIPRAALPSRQQIARQLRQFLARRAIGRLVVAGGTLPPPPLAYMVSFARLSVTLSGEDPVELEQHGRWQRVRLRSGDALFVPPNVANRPAWSGPVKVLTLLFGARSTGISLVAGRHDGSDTPIALKAQVDAPPESPCRVVLSALASLAAADPGNPAALRLVEALLHLVAGLLDRAPSDLGSKAQRTYQSLCLYVQEQFHLDLSRESVADHFGLSANHVSRLFRQQGLMTFADYLNWVRIDRAKLLLRRHPFTLGEVARRCGFHQVSYFCRVFKARTKLTPTQYRLGSSVPNATSDAAPSGF